MPAKRGTTIMSESGGEQYSCISLISYYIESRIQLSTQAKNHPLFPLLDGIIRKQIQQEHSINAIAQMQKELLTLMKKHCKESYKLSDDGFDVSRCPLYCIMIQ